MSTIPPLRVTVVGASQLGCKFALQARAAGYCVTLVDEHPQSIGQMSFDAPYFYGAALPAALSNENAIAQVVLESNPQIFACFEAGIDVRIGTIAWGAFQNGPNCLHIGKPKVGLVNAQGNELLEHDALVLATGVRDFVPSFAGSELPGVFGVKAGVALLDLYQCYEGKKTLVLGTTDRAVAFVKSAIARGVHVVGMVEPGQSFVAGQEALAEVNALGVPTHFGMVILQAEGTVSVKGARLKSIDGTQNVMVDCDSVCAAIGVMPNVEIPSAMNCQMLFDRNIGSWLPQTDSAGRTSLEQVYWLTPFNDGVNVDDTVKAIAQTPSAALALQDSVACSDHASYMRQWVRALHHTGGGMVTLCKCESVTRQAFLGIEPPTYLQGTMRHPHSPITASSPSPLIHQDQLKRMTRVGMGHCQGKRCRDEAAMLLSEQYAVEIQDIKPGTYRFPVRPIDLCVIAAEDDTPDTRDKWSYWLHAPENPTK